MNYVEYTVRKNDSLYEIAKKYNITVEDLMRFNNLSNDMIFPNQILFIPMMNNKNVNPNSKYYTTKKYDTLEMIANNHRIKLEELYKNNDVEKLYLEENQRININNNYEHIINNNDDINTILKKYNLSTDELINLNKNEWFRTGKSVKIR